MKKLKLSIIIPVHEDSQGLVTTLESIKFHLRNRKDTEIIVCNDGGGDNISKIAESYNVNEVILKKNKGSYAARNKGIEASKGDILVFLDADQKITENWIDAGIAVLSDADYAGGNIKIGKNLNPSFWELVDEITAFPVEEDMKTLHFAPTANLFVRKEVFKKTGYFIETLRSGGDKEFGIRVFESGLKQVYVPEAITLHPARNREDQIKKLKRTAIGNTKLALLVHKKNRLRFILHSFKNLNQVFIEFGWRLFRNILFEYWMDDKIQFRFIFISKLRKIIYSWHVMISAIKITIGYR